MGGGQGEAYDFDLSAFARRFGFDVRTAYSSLKALERAGYILLTEAIFQPAKVQFIATKQQLYDYQIKNRGMEKLVKSILRTSQGAFLHPVQIDEGSLANFLKVTTEQLQRTFGKMAGEGILEYFPTKDSPQLVFIEERIDPDNLRIDHQQYNFLRDQARHRVETMIEYAKLTAGCRSQFLLRYFGEQDAPRCGGCDLCRRDKVAQRQVLTPKKVYADVRDQLAKHREMTVEDVVTHYGKVQRRETEQSLSHLIREGLIVREGDKLRLP